MFACAGQVYDSFMKPTDTSSINNSEPRRSDILNALKQSIDNFQEALNLAGRHPQIGKEDILVIQEAIAKANQAYSNIFALQFIHGSEEPVVILKTLQFRKPTAQSS